MVRAPIGVHGVWVNGLQVFDGQNYSSRHDDGPGRVIKIFDS
jgi:hypothetical protein